MAELQFIVRPRPIVLQNDRGIIGLAGFLGPAAGELHPSRFQQRGGDGFCQLLLFGGEEFAVFPEDEAAVPVLAEKALLTDIEIDTEPGLDTEDNSDNVTLPDGFTYSFRDPDNADGIVVTPRE